MSDADELIEAALSFAIDARAAAVIALRYPMTPLERQTIEGVLHRASSYLDNHLDERRACRGRA